MTLSPKEREYTYFKYNRIKQPGENNHKDETERNILIDATKQKIGSGIHLQLQFECDQATENAPVPPRPDTERQ